MKVNFTVIEMQEDLYNLFLLEEGRKRFQKSISQSLKFELVEVEIEFVEEGRSWCLAMDENEASWSLAMDENEASWSLTMDENEASWSLAMDENEARGKFWERKGNEVIKLIHEGYYWKEI